MISAVADRWKDFGSNLGLSHETLKMIDDSQGSDLCLEKVLSLWLNTIPNPTFEVLVEALMRIGHHRIAFEVRKMSGITSIFRGKSAQLSSIDYLTTEDCKLLVTVSLHNANY